VITPGAACCFRPRRPPGAGPIHTDGRDSDRRDPCVWRTTLACRAKMVFRACGRSLRAARYRLVSCEHFHLARDEGDETRHLLARHDGANGNDTRTAG